MHSVELAQEHHFISRVDAIALDVDRVKKHLKVQTDSDDDLLEGVIESATQYFQEQTGRQVLTATREVWMDAFPYGQKIQLPNPPLQSVVSVSFVNGDGDLVEFVDDASPAVPLYAVKAPQGAYAGPGWIQPLYGHCWPIARCEAGAVRIRYTCGYGDGPASVPVMIRGLLDFYTANFHKFRGSILDKATTEVPLGMKTMLDGFKFSALGTVQHRRYVSGLHRGHGPW